METKKILLDGFHVTFDSRALFMQEMFRYPKVRDEAVLRLLKAGELEELKNVFPEPEKYYAMFLQSQYKDCKMTGCIPVEYVWDMRLVIGVLLELRQVKDKILYQKVMRVIYSGYKTLKRDLKKHSYITGNILKEINSNFKNIKQDAMQMCSQILISFILMEELNIEMMWDFSIGLLLPFIERYEHELEQGYPTDEIDEKVEAKQSEWREKFYDTYDRQLSVRSLLLEKHDDDNADAVMQVMSLFDIHPRKFEEYELTEQELRLLMAQKEKWNSKICWGAIIIAQLCKYIRALEERFLNETSQILNLKAFIDYSSVENPEKCEESNKEIDTSYWTEKRVLVIGGHPIINYFPAKKRSKKFYMYGIQISSRDC